MARLLIVEDDLSYRELLREKLVEEGFEIVVAENAEAGLRLVKDGGVDLILLDLLMPGTDGQTFFYHLKHTAQKNTPVIVLTNLTEAAYPSEARDFIVKANVSLDELVSRIKAQLVGA